MLTKVLFTILVISAVLLFVRHRTAARGAPRAADAAPAWVWRALPATLLLAALGVGALVFWLEWQEQQRLFTARVVDTRTGEVRNYLVHRDQVQGRTFTTVDGRTVTLADVERLELVEDPAAGP